MDNRLRRGDVVAGISVAVVLIPQSLAYASLAGLPPVHGLYASVLPVIIAALLVSCPYLQTGPVAMTSLLTLGALSTLAAPFSADYVGLAALLALTVGVIRLLIGAMKAGFIAYLKSQPVLTGFTTAAAVLIVAMQLPAALGLSSAPSEDILTSVLAALMAPGEWVGSAVLLTLGLTQGGMITVLQGPSTEQREQGAVMLNDINSAVKCMA